MTDALNEGYSAPATWDECAIFILCSETTLLDEEKVFILTFLFIIR